MFVRHLAPEIARMELVKLEAAYGVPVHYDEANGILTWYGTKRKRR